MLKFITQYILPLSEIKGPGILSHLTNIPHSGSPIYQKYTVFCYFVFIYYFLLEVDETAEHPSCLFARFIGYLKKYSTLNSLLVMTTVIIFIVALSTFLQIPCNRLFSLSKK